MRKRWFFERLFPDVKLGLKLNKSLLRNSSKYQKIQVLDTERFGKVLVLDGIIQTTTEDEFIYHEMMTHIPLLSLPSPLQILIIGGGDGGILREVLKHKSVKKATLVEIDKKVIDYSKRYLSSICKDSFANKKTELIIGDGAKFIKNTKYMYDVIIIDSSDPIGPAQVLFQKEFYTDLRSALKKDGIMVRQCGSSFLQKDEIVDNFKKAKKIFKYTAVYNASVPTYIGGFFNLMFCSQKIDPKKLSLKTIETRYSKLNGRTKYYNPEIHLASFKLPNYTKERIGEKN